MSRFFVRCLCFGLGALLGAASGCRKPPPVAVSAEVPSAGGALNQGAAPVNAPEAARVLLIRGRNSVATDLAAAIADLTAARQISPEDPEILSELGLAQFRAGKLQLAEETTRAALRAAHTPAETAAPASNLGKIAEAVGNIDEAVRAYELAVAARPSPEIQQHLDTLKARLTQKQQ